MGANQTHRKNLQSGRKAPAVSPLYVGRHGCYNVNQSKGCQGVHLECFTSRKCHLLEPDAGTPALFTQDAASSYLTRQYPILISFTKHSALLPLPCTKV